MNTDYVALIILLESSEIDLSNVAK